MSSRPFRVSVPISSLDFYAQTAIDSPNVAHCPLLDGGGLVSLTKQKILNRSGQAVVSNNNTLHGFDTLPIKLIRRHHHRSLAGFVSMDRTNSSRRAAPRPTHAPRLGRATPNPAPYVPAP